MVFYYFMNHAVSKRVPRAANKPFERVREAENVHMPTVFYRKICLPNNLQLLCASLCAASCARSLVRVLVHALVRRLVRGQSTLKVACQKYELIGVQNADIFGHLSNEAEQPANNTDVLTSRMLIFLASF